MPSLLRLRGDMSLGNFIALELRDLVIQAEGEISVVLQKNEEVRLASVQIDRPREKAKAPALRIVRRRPGCSMTGCAVDDRDAATSAVFQDIAAIAASAATASSASSASTATAAGVRPTMCCAS